MGKEDFRWRTHSAETTDVYPPRRSHSDPTADAAIGNISREERRRAKEERKAGNGKQNSQNSPAMKVGQIQESDVEKAFVDAVKAAGGRALKFTSQTMNGVPDRIVLFPPGKCAFVELKAPGKQMRPLQRKRRMQLLALGFPVLCVDTPEQIEPVIEALGKWQPGEPVPTGIGAEIPELKNTVLPESAVLPEDTTLPENTVLPKNAVLPENAVLPDNAILPENITTPPMEEGGS